MSRKNSDKYQKWGVIIMGALFLTSMAGVAFNSSSGGSWNVELPEKFILDEDLDDDVRSLIYSTGGTVIVFESDSLCGFECVEMQRNLEGLTFTYKPYVYLVLLSGDTGVRVENYFGVVDLNITDIEAVEDKVCEVLVQHPTCVERDALAAVFNYNYTRNEVNQSSDEMIDDLSRDIDDGLNESVELVE